MINKSTDNRIHLFAISFRPFLELSFSCGVSATEIKRWKRSRARCLTKLNFRIRLNPYISSLGACLGVNSVNLKFEMPNDAIYLISDSGELQRVEHQLYKSEDILQQLVAKHPEVLAGDQIDPEAPIKWLLLRREAAIPDTAGGQDRWRLDHLLLDQFGVPTLVEVKRSSDTRIRRKVIGQMLDYVANAQAYWAAGRMRQMLADEIGSLDAADARLAEHLGLGVDLESKSTEVERFWQKVEANLRDGNVRLLFVADELPARVAPVN